MIEPLHTTVEPYALAVVFGLVAISAVLVSWFGGIKQLEKIQRK